MRFCGLLALLAAAWLIHFAVVVPVRAQPLAAAAPAVQEVSTEEKAISSFLMNCIYFGHWPEKVDPAAQKLARVGVLGKDTLGKTLDTVAGKFASGWVRGGRVIIQRSNKAADLEDCHVIFISAQNAKAIESAVAAFKGKPVVLVGRTKDFLEQGGTVQVRIDQKGAFSWDLNLDQLGPDRVNFSSQMKKRAASFLRRGQRETNPCGKAEP